MSPTTAPGTALAQQQPAPLAPVLLGPGISIVQLAQLQADLQPFEVNVEDIEGQVERAQIIGQDSYQGGSDILSAIQIELNRLEAKRVEVKKPADDYGTMVQKLVKPIRERLDEAKRALSGKMLTWRNEEEARQRKAQEEIRRQQQEEADRLAAEARAKGNDQAAEAIETMVASAPTAPAPKVGHANYAGKTHSKRVYWNGAVQDPMEILKQIVAGTLPIHIVEFSKSGLNQIATEHIKKLPEAEQQPKIYLGIKITKDEKLL